MPEVEPLLLAGLLYLGGGLALSLGRLVAGARLREARLARSDLPRVLAVVVLGGIVGPLALVNGLRTVSGVSGALLLNLEGPVDRPGGSGSSSVSIWVGAAWPRR